MSPRERILRAPLVPVAILATAGIVVDRLIAVPVWVYIGLIAVGLPGWMLIRRSGWIGLAIAIVGLGGLYHNACRNVYPSDDVGFLVTDELRLVRLRGRIAGFIEMLLLR